MAGHRPLKSAAAELRAALAQVCESQQRVYQVGIGRQLERVDARIAEPCPDLGLPACGSAREAPAKTAIVRIDENLLARFRILDQHEPEVREFPLERIVEPHGKRLVALRELRKRLLPAWRADEIGHDEDEGPAAGRLQRGP